MNPALFEHRGGLKRRVVSAITLILFALSLSLASVTASAQSAGQGLEISPPLIDKKLDPGTVTTVEIRVRNVTKARILAKTTVDDFTAQGEDGQPRILIGENVKDSPYSIKQWVGNLPVIDLDPNEADIAKIQITVPSDASPGAHFGVVRFTAISPGAENDAVSLSASIGSLVLANVSGDAQLSAQVEEVFISQKGKRKSIFEYGPLTITERIKNTGNVYFKPVGNIRVKNMFNGEVANLAVNKKRGNILPNTIRKFEQPLDRKYMFGMYTAELSILYGDTNQTLSSAVTFWVIPYKLVAIILLLIVGIYFIVRGLTRRYKRKLQSEMRKKRMS